jgi:hypothetical protein
LEPRSPNSPIVFVEAQGYSSQQNKFYPSFFTKIFTYLRDYEPPKSCTKPSSKMRMPKNSNGF